MIVRRFVALLVVGGGVISACGGQLESECGAYFDAIVEVQADCTGGVFQLMDPSVRAQYVQYCSAIASAPGGGNLPSEIASCTSATKSGSCTGSGITDCDTRGTRPDGARCGNPGQCAGGQCNIGGAPPSETSELACGTCASYAAIGASCATATCDPAQAVCVTTPNDSICTAFAEEGGDCSMTLCKPGLDCVGAICQPLPAQGQACSAYCQTGLRCVGGTCQTGVQAGGACPSGFECASGLWCNTSRICQQPVVAQSGQACGTSGVVCASGLTCTGSTCEPPKGIGDGCTVGQLECGLFLVCADGKCAEPDYSLCN